MTVCSGLQVLLSVRKAVAVVDADAALGLETQSVR